MKDRGPKDEGCLPTLSPEPLPNLKLPALLCLQDAGTAKKLANSREVNARCVSLEGDDFNPNGLLTGGSRNTDRCMLNVLHQLQVGGCGLPGFL